MAISEEARKRYIKALLEERAAYVANSLDKRVEDVDAELRNIGAEGEIPSARAEKRPAASRTKKKPETR
jgi:hypothetical protein